MNSLLLLSSLAIIFFWSWYYLSGCSRIIHWFLECSFYTSLFKPYASFLLCFVWSKIWITTTTASSLFMSVPNIQQHSYQSLLPSSCSHWKELPYNAFLRDLIDVGKMQVIKEMTTQRTTTSCLKFVSEFCIPTMQIYRIIFLFFL